MGTVTNVFFKIVLLASASYALIICAASDFVNETAVLLNKKRMNISILFL